MVFSSDSAEQTLQIAADFAKKFKSRGGVIALIGDLGAGKTTFSQGFAKSLGIKDRIISPTFVLIREHPIPKTKQILYHIDLYRLDNTKDITKLGIKEIIWCQDNIVLIEWAEKIKDQLPKQTIFINLEKISDNKRKIVIK